MGNNERAEVLPAKAATNSENVERGVKREIKNDILNINFVLNGHSKWITIYIRCIRVTKQNLKFKIFIFM